ncbi:MAG: hypothetical protein OIF48_03310 [Silicimonas sp.]|nr:hypothetical protein [Silicimonas sp.]
MKKTLFRPLALTAPLLILAACGAPETTRAPADKAALTDAQASKSAKTAKADKPRTYEECLAEHRKAGRSQGMVVSQGSSVNVGASIIGTVLVQAINASGRNAHQNKCYKEAAAAGTLPPPSRRGPGGGAGFGSF